MVLGACATPEPEKIIETVQVETVKTVEVQVEGQTVVVTATPEPPKSMEFMSADPETLYYVAFSEGIDTLDPAWNYESEGDAAILNIYEQLVTYNGPDATSFVPALAES
jgi:ABC-type oligopeptide transport system substrate-binding subunit